MFGVYLIIYPYASKAAIDLTRKHLKHSPPARLLMPADAIQLGLAIGLSGCLYPLASTSLLLLYTVTKSCLVCVTQRGFIGSWQLHGFAANTPVNLLPPFATLLCMAGLAIQFGFAVSLPIGNLEIAALTWAVCSRH